MSEEIISAEDRRLKEFQAMYYSYNARPDTTTKIYNQQVVIKMDDLLNLENMIKEKLSLHRIAGEVGKTHIFVNTSKHKVYSFDDWKLFYEYNWKIPEHIESITLIWDFYINVEGYKNPQRHKLSVRISSGLKPQEILSLIFSGKVEDIEEIEMQEAQIIAQMDFIENRLGQELINVVSEWVDILEKASDSQSSFILFLKGRRKIVGYYFNYVLFIIVFFMLVVYGDYTIKAMGVDRISDITSSQFIYLFNYVALSVVICIVIVNIGENVANKVFRKLSEYGENFVFRITNGDNTQYNKLKKEDNKNAVKVMLNVCFSLLLNIICGIVASVIYSKL